MVRQDKITYLVTSFQNNGVELPLPEYLPLWIENSTFSDKLSNEIINGDHFPGNVINNRVLNRLGVIYTSDIEETEVLMSEFIPYNRHVLFLVNIESLGNQICTAFNPDCMNCDVNDICDYFNERNRWAI